MQCKFHPDRRAEYICFNCNAPLCEECAEEIRPGVYSCFQCAMLQQVSDVGSDLTDRKKRFADQEEKRKKRIKFGAFQYFLVVSGVLLAVMWGVILFGGQPAPPGAQKVAKKGRVLLFMVDGALKRYAHYERGEYPEELKDLVPKYLSFEESDFSALDRLSYDRRKRGGYRLALANPKKSDMNVVLSADGLVQSSIETRGID